MAGGSTSEMIIFIGAIIAASALAGAGIAVSQDFATAYEARLDAQAQRLASDITIINDARDVPTSPLELYVRNTGAEYLWTSTFVVIVDGQVAGNVTASQAGIGPGEWAALTVTGLSLAAGDHQATVFADSTVSDDIMFRVGSP